jgi:hypothetical protein
MENKSMGIDYGMGASNINPLTGIRYGVISQNEVLQAWADSSEPYYGEEEMEEDDYDAEPIFWFIDDGEYKAECGDDGEIFITKSPYYTTCAFCSPCAPGAGYLMDYRENGIKAYCFGHDWFEDEKAPYKVFRVDNDSVVNP